MTRRVVPLDGLERLYSEQADEIRSAVEKVLASGRYTFTKGKEVESFERAFADYIGTGDCVGVSSGTAALELALRALGIGPGDEVIVPTNSFIATAEAVSAVGATPVLVDVAEATSVLTAEIVEAALTAKTRCAIPVHLYGRTVEMGPLADLCRAKGIYLVEDACQAHGSTYEGRRAGSLGDVGCFSFYPTKNLGAWGDGGLLTTHRATFADSLRLLRAPGIQPRYSPRVVGTNSRLDTLQAAVLNVKLPHLDAWAEQRQVNADRYFD